VKTLRFKTARIDVEVKVKKAGNLLLTPKPKINLRTEDGVLVQKLRVVSDREFLWHGKRLTVETRLIDPETQKPVPTSEVMEVVKHHKNKLVKANGEEVKKHEILKYAVQPDGSESLVMEFSRTQLIEIPEDDWVPSTIIEGFLVKDVYEMFCENIVERTLLWEESEKRLKADQIGITTYVREDGFKQFYAFLCPFISEGKFVWIVKLSDNQVELRQLQDIPSKVKIPIKEVPTLKSLPPVQALVVVAKSRKK